MGKVREIEWGHWAVHFITFWFMKLCQFWWIVELILAYILWVDLTVNLVWRQQAFHDCQLIFISSFTYSSSWEVLSGCSCKTEYSGDNNMEIEVMIMMIQVTIIFIMIYVLPILHWLCDKTQHNHMLPKHVMKTWFESIIRKFLINANSISVHCIR